MKSTLSFALRREFAWDEMISECQTRSLVIANMEGSRFRRPNYADEEAAWLEETTPQNTRHSTKWRVKIFKKWDSAPSNKVAANESLGFDYEEVDEVVEYLTVDLWMTKFVGEIDNRSGGRYPQRSLYQIVCEINRDVYSVNGEEGVNMLAKGDQR